ncbi:hypothetical protein [Nocardioides psychrotolerans]|uniref:hypothetical protein n=1 Tax=Nocardioides psychrotolerans TaxID=1005945 RepID=UPI0031378C84
MADEQDYTTATTAITSASDGATVAITVDAIQGMLQGIEVDEATIKAIVSILDSSIDGLALPLEPVRQTAFGGSEWGSMLAFHTDVAHGKVRDAMTDMVTGLSGFREGIDTYVTGVETADVVSGEDSRGIQSVIDSFVPCLAQPDVTTNTSCNVPTGGSR